METVLIFRNEVLPVSETFIRNQAGAVTAFDVRFTGLGPARTSSPEALRGGKPTLLTSDHSFASRLHRNLYVQSGLGSLNYLRKLDRLRPSLIHAHFAPDATNAIAIAEQLQVPLVTTLHGYDVTMNDAAFSQDRNGRAFLRRREKLFNRSHHFFASCSYIRDRAIQAGFPAERIEVLYSGHDPNKFAIPQQERNRNLILYIGRLVEKKGGRYLLQAAAQASKKHPDLEVAIIGDGPLREELKALAVELKLNCRFLGRLLDNEPGNSVFDWISRARVFCMPSVTAENGDTEGQPAVFVEAHALGTPAVSFKTAGIGEAVLDGETGLLAPERDVNALSESLLKLLQDDQLWASYSERGKSWVWERFDIRKINRQLEAAYRKAIDTYK